MKKLVLSITVVCMFATACHQVQDTDPMKNDFSNEISVLTEMNKVGFNISQHPELGFEREQILKDMLSKFNGMFFEMDDAAAEIFIREVSNPSRYADALEGGEIDLSLYDIYSEQQIVLAQPFIDKLLVMEDMMTASTRRGLFAGRNRIFTVRRGQN